MTICIVLDSPKHIFVNTGLQKQKIWMEVFSDTSIIGAIRFQKTVRYIFNIIQTKNTGPYTENCIVNGYSSLPPRILYIALTVYKTYK